MTIATVPAAIPLAVSPGIPAGISPWHSPWHSPWPDRYLTARTAAAPRPTDNDRPDYRG